MKKNYKIPKEEKELYESIENDEWVSVDNVEDEKKRVQAIAKHSGNKVKRVNLRMTEKDYNAAHAKAIEEGLPYQTLLASVIHKYLTGRLIEKNHQR